METTVVENHAALPPAAFDPIRGAVEEQRTMERALAWFFAQVPPLVPADLVPQDEFSYDLLVPYRDGLVLSYATD